MDGLLYYGALVILALLTYTFYQNNSHKLALLTILIGVYIIYSHSTGNTATAYKNEVINSIKDSTENFDVTKN